MTYELAKELKDAGFPQALSSRRCEHNLPSSLHEDCSEVVYIPTLSELIEACGDKFGSLTRMRNGWDAIGGNPPMSLNAIISHGSTPDEAIARLWLALNKPSKQP